MFKVDQIFHDYYDAFILLIVASLLSGLLLFLAFLLSPKVGLDTEKIAAYECGFEPFSEPFNYGRITFDVHFFIVGVLFLIFDLEIVFLFPWAVCLGNLGFLGYFSMLLFLAILTVGFVYEWFKGALTWSKIQRLES